MTVQRTAPERTVHRLAFADFTAVRQGRAARGARWEAWRKIFFRKIDRKHCNRLILIVRINLTDLSFSKRNLLPSEGYARSRPGPVRATLDVSKVLPLQGVGKAHDPGVSQMGRSIGTLSLLCMPFCTQNGRGFGIFRMFLMLSLR